MINMAHFRGEIVGYDYSTYEPAWKTRHTFKLIGDGKPIVADYRRKTTFRDAIEKLCPEWKVTKISTDKPCGMVSMELIPADGRKVVDRCDAFFCELIERI